MSLVLLGVTGGIAAYKAAEVASRLRQAGCEVRVVMTAAATRFVAPLTFEALTHHPVVLDQFELGEPAGIFAEGEESSIEHVALPQRADLILIAPATANCLAKLACGMADDFLTTAVLAANAPILLAPSMNDVMWANPVVQENLQRLVARGMQVIPPGEGRLACESVGPGRLAEPPDIVARALALLGPRGG